MLVGQESQNRYEELYPSCPPDASALREIHTTGVVRLVEVTKKYRILAKVHESETETVFRAEVPQLNQEVFLWILDPLIMPPGAYERINREILISKRVTHENIATQYNLQALEDGSYLLVTEALPGIFLTDVMQKERLLRPKRAIHWARQICYALQAAHKQGIYHGAFNPRYLFVGSNQGPERIKLYSFGIAKLIAHYKLTLVTKLDESKDSLRDLAYLAPEHTRKSSLSLLDESMEEIYSLGVLLYEMLAGELPFEAKTAQDMLEARNGNKAAPPIRDRNPDFDLYPLLDDAVLKALAKDPRERYQSIEEFLLKLDELFEEVDKPKSAFRINVSVEFAIKRRPIPEPIGAPSQSLPQPATNAGRPQSVPAGVSVCAAPALAGIPKSKTPVAISKRHRARSHRSGLVAAVTSAIVLALLASLLAYTLRRASMSSTPAKASAASRYQPPRSNPAARVIAPRQDQSSATKLASPAVDTSHRAQPINHSQKLSAALDNGIAVATKPSSPANDTLPSPRRIDQSPELSAALDKWIAAMNARDIGRLETFYMPELSTFYGARNVAQEDVLAKKARLFRGATRIHVRARAPKITIDEDGGMATILFRKPYVIQSKQQSLQGEVLQELQWMKTDEGWKIASEDDIKVIR